MSKPGNNPVIPPRPEVPPYMGGGQAMAGIPPPPPERTTSTSANASTGSVSKTPVRKEPPPIPPHPEPDWMEREELRARELEEARARAAQMEKTMRWWSDCTANWREKWSKVRNERNKARDECRHLRSKLETAVKECCNAKRERNELRMEVASLKKTLGGIQSVPVPSQSGTLVLEESKDKNKDLPEPSVCSSIGSDQDLQSTITTAEANELKQDSASSSNVVTGGQEDFLTKLLSRKEKDNLSSSSSHSDKSEKRKRAEKRGEAEGSSSSEDILVQQKLSMLQLKLEEAQKTLLVEREEKGKLMASVDTMQDEIVNLKSQHDDLKQSSDEAVKQLTQLREEHAEKVGQMASELEDESSRSDTMDKRLADLRKELENLQAENAQEWGKRERLETEKLALERENKKLKKEIEVLEEEIEKKNQQASAVLDTDLKTSQMELVEKNRELADLRHVHGKMKKALAEKSAEYEHAKSRADQYEAEVKKLRTRVDELKKDLTTAEDEADQHGHQVRKLQRSNDELQQQVENLSVQVENLQTRLLKCNPSASLAGTRTASLKSLEGNDSTTEGQTGEDTDDCET